MSTTEEHTFPMYFDALTRKCLWYRNEQLIDYREIKSKGLREIAHYPSVRPKLGDLRVMEIDSVLKSLHASSESRRDLVAIRGIESCRKWFVPALALVYSREGTADLQVGVLIGGKLSSEHERVLTSLPSFSDFIKNALPIRSEIESDIALVEGANSQTLKASETLQTAIAEASSQKADVEDHPLLLQDALKTAKQRMLVISPWIKADVVDKDFLNDLEKLLRAGVAVYIGHGITPNPTKMRGPLMLEQRANCKSWRVHTITCVLYALEIHTRKC